MNKIEANDTEAQSADIVADNLSQLQSLFPEAFAEGKVRFDVLRQLLGDAVDEADEKYGLNWHGKRRARQIALTPSTGTLRPCPDESVDWDTTQNLMIEGDNLEVLKLLQKSYAGKVKLIYIDPPYNTGKDFVYPDNFRDSIGNYLELTGQAKSGERMSANAETNGRFHTDWLNMMYPRLRLARSLMRDDGALFVSIDDNEASNMRFILDDIFGIENFICTICWQKFHSVKSNSESGISQSHDYVLVYAKNRDQFKIAKVPMDEEALKVYKNPDNDPRGLWRTAPLTVSLLTGARGEAFQRTGKSTGLYKIVAPNGKEYLPGAGRCWISERTVNALREDSRIWWGKDGNAIPMEKIFLTEQGGEKVMSTFWTHDQFGSNKLANEQLKELFDHIDGGTTNFPTPKPLQLILAMLALTGTKDDDIVLDFFAGSGTTGHAVSLCNVFDSGKRRYILVQLPEATGRNDFKTIADITKERLRRAGKQIRAENPDFSGDTGFRVFSLDKSNIREWSPTLENLPQSLLDHHEHILDGRTEADITYELLLKLGLDLCVPMEKRTVAGKSVEAVGGGVLMLCLAEKLAAAEVEAVAAGIVAWHKELAPAGDSTVVFRDSAFDGDVAKTNMAAILAQNGLENIRSL